jgi:hypothetical protein
MCFCALRQKFVFEPSLFTRAAPNAAAKMCMGDFTKSHKSRAGSALALSLVQAKFPQLTWLSIGPRNLQLAQSWQEESDEGSEGTLRPPRSGCAVD